jgi:hypothetical protein
VNRERAPATAKPEPPSGSRALGAVVSIALIAATLYPVTLHPYDDSFPLSTYPMFASPRKTTIDINYVVGFSQRGDVRWHVPPSVIGSSEVLQAKQIVDRAVGGGPPKMRELCERIARRVRAGRSDIAYVAIVFGRHDAVDYLVRGVRGTERELHRCTVPS